MTDDPVYQLEGQTGPTVLEWFPRECSIVDIPGNYNAIARLYDEADNLLHDLTDKRFNMDKKTIEVEALGLPNLSAEASAEDVRNAIKEINDHTDEKFDEVDFLKQFSDLNEQIRGLQS